MTPDLDLWLQRATSGLSNGSAAQVRAEIQEHYESAREAAILGGASAGDADRMALSALGDAKIANTAGIVAVLLTTSGAKYASARAVGDHGWSVRFRELHSLLLAVVRDCDFRRCRPFSDRRGRSGAERSCTRPGHRIHDPGTASSRLYGFTRTRIPLRPVDGTGWSLVYSLRSRRAADGLAADPPGLPVGVDGMEARLDSPQAAGRRLAAATLSVDRRDQHCCV